MVLYIGLPTSVFTPSPLKEATEDNLPPSGALLLTKTLDYSDTLTWTNSAQMEKTIRKSIMQAYNLFVFVIYIESSRSIVTYSVYRMCNK